MNTLFLLWAVCLLYFIGLMAVFSRFSAKGVASAKGETVCLHAAALVALFFVLPDDLPIKKEFIYAAFIILMVVIEISLDEVKEKTTVIFSKENIIWSLDTKEGNISGEWQARIVSGEMVDHVVNAKSEKEMNDLIRKASSSVLDSENLTEIRFNNPLLLKVASNE